MSADQSAIKSLRKRSFWRGVLAGLVAHYLTVALLLSIVLFLRPFAWPVIVGSPYISGPIDPNSNEGTFMQVIGLLSWIPAGFAAQHWSRQNSYRSVLTIFGYLALLPLLSILLDSQPTMPLPRAIWYYASGPIGLAFGVIVHLRGSCLSKHPP